MTNLQKKLVDIFINRFSGKITLKSETKNKTIFFKQGEVVYATSSNENDLFLKEILSNRSLEAHDVKVLEALFKIEEQQKYILKKSILDAKSLFTIRQKVVEKIFSQTFFEEYQSFSTENLEQEINHLNFKIDSFSLILGFVKNLLSKNDCIDDEQSFYLSDKHKHLFLEIRFKTSFRKVLDALNKKQYSLKELIEKNIVNKSQDTYVFLNFLFILGFLGESQSKKSPQLQNSTHKNSEENLETTDHDNILEEQVKRLISAAPHLLIGADRNLSEAILYKNTTKLIKRYDLLNNSKKKYYSELYANLFAALYILTSSEQSKEYYKCIAEKKEYILDQSDETKAMILFTQAKLFFSENKLTLSLEAIKNALALIPSNNNFKIFMYSVVLYYCEKNQKNPSDTIEKALRVIARKEEYCKEANITLSEYYKITGDKKKQFGALKEALETDPSDLLLEKKVERLKKELSNKSNISKGNSGIFKSENTESKKIPFAGLFSKKKNK